MYDNYYFLSITHTILITNKFDLMTGMLLYEPRH